MSTARSLLLLARPKGSLMLLVGPLTAYGFAHWDYGLEAQRPLALAGVLVAWIFLSAGSLWLNAALDGDEDGALFARAATRPAHLPLFGYGALAAAVAIASLADERSGACCAICAVLAVLYSHPRTMWKAHPVLGPAVNAIGYGVLSWLAGFFVVRVPLSARTAAAMALATIFVFGMSFAAQAYQRDDDARRGYRTLVVTHGPAACLRVASISTLVALAGVAALAAAGAYPRLVLVGLPVFVLAARTMSRWRRAPGGGSPEIAAEFAVRMAEGGAVLVALATIDALVRS
ncbi:MAG TPA: UbiA family prenyltransferase [Polyangiaceae bacterium]|jgi:4-hydroxybenzoate polyprenyltransferase